MRKFLFLLLVLPCTFFVTSCSNIFTNAQNDITNNATNLNRTSNVYDIIVNDMNKVCSTLRALDVLYYEDYAISELCPIENYYTYQNRYNNYGINQNDQALNDDLPVSNYSVSEYALNYNYDPKYILDVNELDTTYLLAYIQSLQDLFLITNDITAGNEILNNITYNLINEALNVKNNAGLTNINNLSITLEQQNIFSECSIGINTLLNNIINSSGFIDTELNSITNLRENYYKNIEALNIKYITILNIIDNRIVQLQNLDLLLERLNNQLLLISNASFNSNNISQNIVNRNNGNDVNYYNDNNTLGNQNNLIDNNGILDRNTAQNDIYYNNTPINNYNGSNQGGGNKDTIIVDNEGGGNLNNIENEILNGNNGATNYPIYEENDELIENYAIV